MKALALVLVVMSLNAQASIILCTKVDPTFHWDQIMDGKLGWQGRGPGLIINPELKRVTWLGTGGYIRLVGEQTSQGVKVMRIDGRPGQEKILSSKKTGQVMDFVLQDSLGGQGLLRVFLDKSGHGSANWQHATDVMKEDLAFCTTNVLN